MAVTVRAFGMLGSIWGETKLEIDFAGSSIGDLIDELAAKYGRKIKQELLDEDGNLEHAYSLIVGGKPARSLSDKVEDGDDVVITMMMVGG